MSTQLIPINYSKRQPVDPLQLAKDLLQDTNIKDVSRKVGLCTSTLYRYRRGGTPNPRWDTVVFILKYFGKTVEVR